jgi:MFS family permease
MMTLSVWLGMGSPRFMRRLLLSLIATAYMAIWPIVSDWIGSSWATDPLERIRDYAEAFGAYSALVILFGCMFILLGRRLKLVRLASPDALPRGERFQFTVLHVLVLMSLVAVLLTLLRTARNNSGAEDSSSVFGLTADVSLAALTFFLNTACAAYAVLWPSNVRRNIGLVLLVSTLLGIVIAFATRNDESAWWLFVGSMFIGIVPAVVEIVSLLVVRSCGYRLVRRTREVPVVED